MGKPTKVGMEKERSSRLSGSRSDTAVGGRFHSAPAMKSSRRAVALVFPRTRSAVGPKTRGSVPDIFDSATRSRLMARVRSRNTRPELILRRALHSRGLRYRLHDSSLPGRPDLVFPRFGAVCFVHGCFWHRHEGCRRATTPATNRTFWQRKFAANVVRDRNNRAALLEAGWRVGIIWECALRSKVHSEEVAASVECWLKGRDMEFVAGRQ